ncbi:hypothetical protein CEUSTIGMA_g4279.t1 [Chlamydomonas eustigma]|uniref:Uncharacterized protein n=1 Tax=Chlamydomonas eustigma TaxID=1157962 RepID=A0A250X170_9CHLO|nr:hypothetical protein CEUSTIGMA_g4279.t1 [Chlamydomonas eustigma]|eukprot:GAX76833.1 hypothetical protein CEUSTIGMA_g4279.t1 [Chlamydomonas eustigma]
MDRATSVPDCLPSTLTYRNRLEMKSADSNAYASLYSSRHNEVWQRLSFDAKVRSLSYRALKPTPPEALFVQSPRASFACRDEISGFVSNTAKVVYDIHSPMKSGHMKSPGEVQVQDLVPQQLHRFINKHPIDYRAAIRPDSETVNQRMRMLGTYSTDFAYADQARYFIPSGCPGGPATGSWYHPDVRLTLPAVTSRSRYL